MLRIFQAVPHLGTATIVRVAAERVALEVPQDRKAGPALRRVWIVDRGGLLVKVINDLLTINVQSLITRLINPPQSCALRQPRLCLMTKTMCLVIPISRGGGRNEVAQASERGRSKAFTFPNALKELDFARDSAYADISVYPPT